MVKWVSRKLKPKAEWTSESMQAFPKKGGLNPLWDCSPDQFSPLVIKRDSIRGNNTISRSLTLTSRTQQELQRANRWPSSLQVVALVGLLSTKAQKFIFGYPHIVHTLNELGHLNSKGNLGLSDSWYTQSLWWTDQIVFLGYAEKKKAYLCQLYCQKGKGYHFIQAKRS